MLDFLTLPSLTTDQLFLDILNRSLAVIPVMAAALLARWMLKKLPRRLTVILWLVVFFRLLVPFTLESSIGVLPQKEVIRPSAAAGVTVSLPAALDAGQRAVGDVLNGGIDPIYVKTRTDTYNLYHSQVWLIVWGYVWPTGMAAMALYSLFSLIRLKKRLVGAMYLEENVWLCDGIDAPFVLGIFRPKIYLPSILNESARPAILAHERCHIRRFDPAAKLFAWLALCLHWFNPLVWLCFNRFAEDVEMACDEAVTADMAPADRASYTDSLLHLSTGKRPHAASPLAFGEGDPASRIKRILLFRQPKRAVVAAGICAAAVLAFFLVAEHARSPHLLGGGYTVSEILYTDPLSSFYMTTDNAPDFTITGNYHLLTMVNERNLDIVDFNRMDEWEDLGQFLPYDLTRGELDNMTQRPGWASAWRPGRITDAWWLQTGDESSTFYLLLQTSAGDTLLATGYEDLSERGQGASDDTSIRWLVKLAPMSGGLLISTNYFDLDAYHMMGQKTETQAIMENRPENWYLRSFVTEEGGLGFASYQWEGRTASSQLKNGFAKLMQFAYYPPDVLERCTLGLPGCYIAPDPLVTKPGDDPDISLTIDRTYDVVFVTNEEVYTAERVVTSQNGTIINRAKYVVYGTGFSMFSWDQAEGHNPCSVSYRFFDKDGNILSVTSEPIQAE